MRRIRNHFQLGATLSTLLLLGACGGGDGQGSETTGGSSASGAPAGGSGGGKTGGAGGATAGGGSQGGSAAGGTSGASSAGLGGMPGAGAGGGGGPPGGGGSAGNAGEPCTPASTQGIAFSGSCKYADYCSDQYDTTFGAAALQQICEDQSGTWSTSTCDTAGWSRKCTQEVFGGVYILYLPDDGICAIGCDERL